MLDKQRKEINQIDQDILKLLEKRYVCVDEIIHFKTENNLPTLDTSREKDVLNRLESLIETEEYKEAILDTFQSMMDISKEYQHQKRESR